jgi:hypothetical protein
MATEDLAEGRTARVVHEHDLRREAGQGLLQRVEALEKALETAMVDDDGRDFGPAHSGRR